jgi:putative ABC transport system permease protein
MMNTVRSILLRLSSLFRKERLDRELNAELASHLDLHTEENLRAGMNPEEARRAALLKLGGVEQTKESVRDRRGIPLLETILQDVRFSLRTLRKNPGFSSVAVLTLAIAIGANTAIFSLVSSVLLRPLPYPASDRLMWVSDYMPRQHSSLVIESDYYAWRSQNQVFQDIAAYEPGETLTLTGAGDPERLHGARTTYNFLDVLGVAPKLGRSFREEEDRPDAPGGVLLSDRLWRERFSADPGVLGRSIELDGQLYAITGVLPPQFEFLDNSHADLIIPSALENREMTMQKGMRVVRVVGRLRDGMTPTTAAANLDAINQRLFAQYPAPFARMFQGAKPEVVPLHERLVGNVPPLLLVLAGAVGFVLLIACANIASLQLARGVSREKEFAVRGALGAGRLRLVRQLLTENLMIALAGGVCGLLLAAGFIRVLRQFCPVDVPHLSQAQLDSRVLCFTLVTSCLAGLLFGLAPAFVSLRSQLVDALKNSGDQPGMGRLGRRSQGFLVVAELAAALVLSMGAGLFVRSFLRLAATPPGFDGTDVLTVHISLPPNLYQTHAQQLAFFQQLDQRVAAIPGAEATGMASILPLQGQDSSGSVEIEGHAPELPGQTPQADVTKISPGYFKSLRIPLIAGSLLDTRDSQNASNALVVNQAFLRRFFPQEDPIGKRVRIAREDWWTIVGIVGDAKQDGLGSQVRPQAFVSIEKWTAPDMSLVVWAKKSPQSLLSAVHSIVAELDKNLPLYDVQTMEELLSAQTASQRFNTSLLSAFAFIAVLLSCLGIYGVTAYAVNQRTRELGLRMALGAAPRNVLKMILRQAAALTCLGLALGTGISFALARSIENLLFKVRPADPVTYTSVSLLLIAVVMIACYIPARRATQVDPMVALRYE